MAARGMAIKPAGLQLSDALVRKARLARCRVIENERYRWRLGGEEGEEHGGVIENPTRAAFPRCRSVLIARNCVRASWNFLLPPVKKNEVTPVRMIGRLPFSFLFVRRDLFVSRIWIVLLIFLSREREGERKRKEIPDLTLSRRVFESF